MAKIKRPQVPVVEIDETEDVLEVLATYMYFEREYRDRFEATRLNNSFVANDQWNSTDKSELQKDGRPVVTLNIVLPLVMQLMGMQSMRGRSWKIVPVDDYADDKLADLLTRLMLFVSNYNDLDIVDEQVFAAGVIGATGWYYVPPPNLSDDPDGNVVIIPECNLNVMVDPDAKSPLQKDWKRVIRFSWMTLDDIRNTWPEKVGAISKTVLSSLVPWEQLSGRLQSTLRSGGVPNGTSKEEAYSSRDALNEITDSVNDMYKVVELWQRKKRWVDLPDGSRKRETYLQLTVTFPFANILLGKYELPYEYYPFAGFFCINFGNSLPDTVAYVDALIGPQEEKNRFRSMIADIAQRAIAEGILLPPGESALAQDIKENGSKPGFVGVKANADSKIDKINSGGVPSGLQWLFGSNDIDLQRISMQPLAQLGESEGSGESGVHFRARLNQGQISMNPLFQAAARAKRLLGKIVMERIQKHYTEERIFRIVGREGQSQQFAINKYDWATGQIINDVTIGKYDVLIDDDTLSKTQREETFNSMSEMIKSLPPEAMMILIPEVFENSPLPNRHKIAQMMRDFNAKAGITGNGQQQGEEQQMEQQEAPVQQGMMLPQ